MRHSLAAVPALRCRLLAAAALTALLCGSPAPSLSAARDGVVYVRAADQKPMAAAEVISDLAETRIIILGEVHGSRTHHEVQLDLLRALRARGRRLVIGMEMFPASVNPELERWSEGEMDSSEIFLRFGQAWAFDWWPVYRDLFFLARQEGIPQLGLNADEELVRRVARVGLAGLDAGTRELLPLFSCDSADRYIQLLGQAMNGGSNSETTFMRFCEAQMLRDAFMARTALAASRKWKNHIVIILAGNYHAWRHGIASHLPQGEGYEVKVVLPGGDISFPDAETLAGETDYLWFTE